MSLHSLAGAAPHVQEASCETDDVGVAACSTEYGPVGWNKKKICAPCPPECVSCEPKNDAVFKCVLDIVRPAEHSALAQLLGTGDLNALPWIKPRGYKCSAPVPRNSDVRRWKTYCHYLKTYPLRQVEDE